MKIPNLEVRERKKECFYTTGMKVNTSIKRLGDIQSSSRKKRRVKHHCGLNSFFVGFG